MDGRFPEAPTVECMYCRGQMQRGTAPFAMDRRGYHVAWDAVPAWVCSQVGETHFEAREVDLIQRELTVLDRESGELTASTAPDQPGPAAGTGAIR
jgi:YgiT-type zinc finger domain-containing protein